jgi:hypothetical protein
VLAADGCELVTRGRLYRLTSPEILHDESRQLVPPLVVASRPPALTGSILTVCEACRNEQALLV